MKCYSDILGKFRRLTVIGAVALLTAAGAAAMRPAASPVQWESIASVPDIDTDDAPKVTVTSRGIYIYVTVRETATIRLYTILGQEISRHTLQPGVWRLRLPSRGIFILKTDGITRRITV